MSQSEGDQTKLIPIPSDMVKRMIRNRASEIKSICDNSGANVIIKDNNSALIIGLPDQIKRAEQLIIKIIEESHGRGVGSKTIQIPRVQVRNLIGPLGETIKLIEKRSGASVKVTNEDKRRITDAEVDVVISGTNNQIFQAQNLISETITAAEFKTEMEIAQDLKIKLKNLDAKVKQSDIFALYPDAHSQPTIMMRVSKDGKVSVLAFQTKSEMTTWMNQLKGKLLCGRKIVKSSDEQRFVRSK